MNCSNIYQLNCRFSFVSPHPARNRISMNREFKWFVRIQRSGTCCSNHRLRLLSKCVKENLQTHIVNTFDGPTYYHPTFSHLKYSAYHTCFIPFKTACTFEGLETGFSGSAFPPLKAKAGVSGDEIGVSLEESASSFLVLVNPCRVKSLQHLKDQRLMHGRFEATQLNG